LVGQLVRVWGACGANGSLGAIVIGRDGDVGGCVAGEVLDVEGGCLAFCADISYGRGPFLIHQLHALPLTRLDT